jgi:alcohol dehydrogenase YqhD (iron-dependent ADH family)
MKHKSFSLCSSSGKHRWKIRLEEKRSILDPIMDWSIGMLKFWSSAKKKCITHHFTVKGTPQQNKVAEMMNRTLLEEVECSFAKKKKIELRQLIMHASSQTDLYLLRLISRFLRKYRQVNKFIIHFENTWLP